MTESLRTSLETARTALGLALEALGTVGTPPMSGEAFRAFRTAYRVASDEAPHLRRLATELAKITDDDVRLMVLSAFLCALEDDLASPKPTDAP